MTTRSTGIVLKTFVPKKQKIAVLDQYAGRIDVVIFGAYVSPGSHISYALKSARTVIQISDVTLENLPLHLAREDLLFLHHILEILYHFLPIGGCIEGIFELLHNLFLIKPVAWSIHGKKIFVFRLLMIIGMYPETQILSVPHIRILNNIQVDTMHATHLDLECGKALDQWLRHVIGHHPLIEYFNTIHFLTDREG